MITTRSTLIFVCVLAALWSTAQGQETVLYSFGSAPDGNYPASALVFDRSGNLYGATYAGGTYGGGVVFKLAQSSGKWTESILYSFCSQSNCADGSQPYSTLILDASGNLYGTTYVGGAYGYGTAFKLTRHTHDPWTETVLHSFGSGVDGQNPGAGLVPDKSGNLYGTTSFGGINSNCFAGCGTVYELTQSSGDRWTESVLYNFCSQSQCSDGNSPESSLVLDSAGNLYGTTTWGGNALADGTVFELSPQGSGQWKQSTIHQFAGGTDGYNPHAGLAIDPEGNLYGTTVFGGADGNNGTVFKMTRESNGAWTERVIYSFCTQFECSDGSAPYGGLTLRSGVLYGTSTGGGSSYSGVVFKFSQSKGKWVETVLYSFGQPGADGAGPLADVVLDAAGNIYGTTQNGGINSGNGIVFKITP